MTTEMLNERTDLSLAGLPSIYELMARVMAGVRAVGKDSTNTSQNYRFRGIDAVVNAVGPVLREHGVIVVPEVLESTFRDVTTSNGKPSREVTVRVRYRFYGPRGDYIDAVTCGESMDFGDKGTPKAMSVAFRVALLQALCLPTDEPDADSQSYERAYREPQQDFGQRPAGPSTEQMAALNQASKEIAACHSAPVLAETWAAIIARGKSGALHSSHFDQLKTAHDQHLAEIGGGL